MCRYCCRQSKEVELAEGTQRLGQIQQDLHTVDELAVPGNSATVSTAVPGTCPPPTQHAAQNGAGGLLSSCTGCTPCMYPVRAIVAEANQYLCTGLQTNEINPVDAKRQQRISEHFGELQEHYLQMCTSQAPRQHSISVGTASVGTEQAAAARLRAPQNDDGTAVLPSDWMQHGATEQQKNNGYAQPFAAGEQPALGVAAAVQVQRNVAMGDEPTQSEERLDQLDSVLRTVTQA